MANGWGGAREGAGHPTGPADPERAAARRDLDVERARLEGLKADEKELDLAVKRGEYLPRAAQRQAAATALAVMTQSLRSIPDNLERTHGLDPAICEHVAVAIDDALAEVALAFKAMA